jgi:hypothetical protein
MNGINPQSTEIQELAKKYQQWIFSPGENGDVLSKPNFEREPTRNCNLYNTDSKLYFQYEEQTWGINLGWTDNAKAETAKRTTRWFFSRENGMGRPITYGERVALAYGTHRSFLYYTSRKFGINLDWSGPPIFEWIIAGGKPGTPVQKNDAVAIWNDKVDLFLIHFDRDIGADVGWQDSKRWADQVSEKLKKLIKEYGDDVLKYAVAWYFGVPGLPALPDVIKKASGRLALEDPDLKDLVKRAAARMAASVDGG